MGFNLGAAPPKRKQKAKSKQAAVKVLGPQSEETVEPGLLERLRGFEDIEADDREELKAVEGTLARVDAGINRITDNGYWFGVVFPDVATRNQFLQKVGWLDYVEEGDYVDGLALAKHLGITLEVQPIRFKGRRADKRLVSEVGVWSPEKANGNSKTGHKKAKGG